MLACVASSMLQMNEELASTKFCALDSHWAAIRTLELVGHKTFFAFKIPIHDFHKQNNSFHLNPLAPKG